MSIRRKDALSYHDRKDQASTKLDIQAYGYLLSAGGLGPARKGRDAERQAVGQTLSPSP